MPKSFAVVALIFAINLFVPVSASAEFFGCNDKPGRVLSSSTSSYGSSTRSASSRYTHEFAAQASRPRITIYSRYGQPGRNAKRHCRAWLAKEYRVSGTVIVPRQQCWWE